jgi:hypothetical protein
VSTLELLKRRRASRRDRAVGEMLWDGKIWRRWSGRSWATAVGSIHPDRLENSTPLDTQPTLTPAQQRHILDQVVENQVTTNGASVVLDNANGVVLSYRRHVSHLAHGLMTLLTGGLWLIVWISVATSKRDERIRLEPDPWGNVWAVPLGAA